MTLGLTRRKYLIKTAMRFGGFEVTQSPASRNLQKDGEKTVKDQTTTATTPEQILGPRGNLVVTTANRREVRKWLNAQGFPALFSGGLSMRELGLAYNDTSGRQLQNLRRKLEEAGACVDGTEQASLPGTEQAQRPTQGTRGATPQASQGQPSQGQPSGNMTEGEAQGQPQGQPQRMTAEEKAEAERQAMAATQRNAEKAGDDDLAQAARNLADIIAARGNREQPAPSVNKEEVREIVRESLKDFDEKIKDLTTTRIEIKLPNADHVETIEGHHHPKFSTLLKAAACRQPDGFRPNILITGPAGSGKTYSCRTVIKALGLDFHYNGALSMAHEVLGYRDANGTYHPTAFFHGYTGKSGYVFDEVDGSDNSPLLALNAALANGCAYFPHGMFDRHADSLIVATANTWGLGATADYVGRSKLDAAFLSRFGVRIFWDYDEKLEQVICGNADWAKRVQAARANARKSGIKVIICPRLSIAGAALIAGGFTEDEAADLTYLANLTPEQRQIVQGRNPQPAR